MAQIEFNVMRMSVVFGLLQCSLAVKVDALKKVQIHQSDTAELHLNYTRNLNTSIKPPTFRWEMKRSIHGRNSYIGTFHDGDIDVTDRERMEILESGTLIIKSTVQDDTGLYEVEVQIVDDEPSIDTVILNLTVKKGSCPNEYVKVNGVCYKFVKEPATWSDAQNSCMEDGAVLVIVSDSVEKNMLMNRTGGSDCWIGLNDQVEEGSFYWRDCSTTTTWQNQQWGDEQPSDVDGDQDCVMMMASGAWNDWMCDKTNQYICEVVDISYEVNPSEFAGVASSPFSVTLTWKPPSHNCDVVEYIIRYKDRSTVKTVKIPGKNSTMAEIEGLRSGTEYSFQIGALTSIGKIEYSDPVVLTTRNFTSSDCTDGTLTDTAGNLTSPNFPSEYPPNADCVYTITLPDSNMRVRLRFVIFDLVDSDDYIEITDLNTGEDDRNMLTLNGVERPKDYVSMTNSVKIRFVSGPLSQGAGGSGFLIGYEEEHEATEKLIFWSVGGSILCLILCVPITLFIIKKCRKKDQEEYNPGDGDPDQRQHMVEDQV